MLIQRICSLILVLALTFGTAHAGIGPNAMPGDVPVGISHSEAGVNCSDCPAPADDMAACAQMSCSLSGAILPGTPDASDQQLALRHALAADRSGKGFESFPDTGPPRAILRR